MGVQNAGGIFQNLQIVLDLGSLPYKKKKKLREDIVNNGGYVSYILTKKSNLLLVPGEKQTKVDTFKSRKAIQLGVPVVSQSYIEDCLDCQALLDTDPFCVTGETKEGKFTKGLIQVTGWESPEKAKTKATLSKEQIQALISKRHLSTDPKCPKYVDSFLVAKFAVFLKPGDSSGKEKSSHHMISVLEFHAPLHKDDKETNALNPYRVLQQSAEMNQKFEPLDKKSYEYFFASCEDGLSVMQYLADSATEKDKMKQINRLPRFSIDAIGSSKLRKLFDNMGNLVGDPNPHVQRLLVGLMEKTMDQMEDVDISDLSPDDINKAVVCLVKLRDAIKDGKDTEPLSRKYYESLKLHVGDGVISDMAELSKQIDFLQLIKDVKTFSELFPENSDLSSSSSSSSECSSDDDMSSGSEYSVETSGLLNAMFKNACCSINWLPPEDPDFKKVGELLTGDGKPLPPGFRVKNIYELYRDAEVSDFNYSMTNKQLLYHSTKPSNFFGIFSRGLLPPLVVVTEHGGKRTDQGMLGSGIYFSDDLRATAQYSGVCEFTSSRLMLVNEVCLGECKTFNQHQTDLLSPPDGYDSVFGVGQAQDSTSAFEYNEYVVYKKSQQRVRYLVEFTLKGDPIASKKETKSLSSEKVSLKSIMEYSSNETENVHLSDIENLDNPLKKVQAGLITLKSGEEKVALLEEVHIRANVVDMVAKVVVFQSYTNTSHTPIEAKYVFPLDDSAAVCGFEAFINNKHVIGQVKPKEVARREYREAVSKGHGAYLMDEEKPDVFTVSIGNLPPDCRVIIKISYVAELPVIVDEKDLTDYIQLNLPSSLAPTVKNKVLVSGEVTQTDVQRFTAEMGKRSVFSLAVSVDMPFDIKKLECPTNKIKFKRSRSKATVSLCNKESLGRDGFKLLIGLAEIHVPRMWVEKHPTLDSEACMLAFYPEFEVEPVLNYRAIIMVDVSPSMKNEKQFVQMKKVALMILKRLPSECLINVVAFASNYRELFVKEQSLKENVVYTKVEDFLQGCSVRKELSDGWRPLSSLLALKELREDRILTNVFLLSDGHLTEEAKVMHLARSLGAAGKAERSSRIFTFSFGSSANQHLMKAIASASSGFHEHFSATARSKWETKVTNQLSKASQPMLSNIRIQWQRHLEEEDEDIPALPRQAPEHITSLFNSQRLVVYSYEPNCRQAYLHATICGQEISTVVYTSDLSVTSGKTLHQLAARATIRDYEDGMHHTDPLKRDDLRKARKPHIVDLSVEHSIVSQYTSFVAIEEREKDEAPMPKKGPRVSDLVEEETIDHLKNERWIGENTKDLKTPVQAATEKIKSAELMYQCSILEGKRMLRDVYAMLPSLDSGDIQEVLPLLLEAQRRLGIRRPGGGRDVARILRTHLGSPRYSSAPGESDFNVFFAEGFCTKGGAITSRSFALSEKEIASSFASAGISPEKKALPLKPSLRSAQLDFSGRSAFYSAPLPPPAPHDGVPHLPPPGGAPLPPPSDDAPPLPPPGGAPPPPLFDGAPPLPPPGGAPSPPLFYDAPPLPPPGGAPSPPLFYDAPPLPPPGGAPSPPLFYGAPPLPPPGRAPPALLPPRDGALPAPAPGRAPPHLALDDAIPTWDCYDVPPFPMTSHLLVSRKSKAINADTGGAAFRCVAEETDEFGEEASSDESLKSMDDFLEMEQNTAPKDKPRISLKSSETLFSANEKNKLPTRKSKKRVASVDSPSKAGISPEKKALPLKPSLRSAQLHFSGRSAFYSAPFPPPAPHDGVPPLPPPGGASPLPPPGDAPPALLPPRDGALPAPAPDRAPPHLALDDAIPTWDEEWSSDGSLESMDDFPKMGQHTASLQDEPVARRSLKFSEMLNENYRVLKRKSKKCLASVDSPSKAEEQAVPGCFFQTRLLSTEQKRYSGVVRSMAVTSLLGQTAKAADVLAPERTKIGGKLNAMSTSTEELILPQFQILRRSTKTPDATAEEQTVPKPSKINLFLSSEEIDCDNLLYSSDFCTAHAKLKRFQVGKQIDELLIDAGVKSLGAMMRSVIFVMVLLALRINFFKEKIAKCLQNPTELEKQKQALASAEARLKELDSKCPGVYFRLELGMSWEKAAEYVADRLQGFAESQTTLQ